MNCLASVSSSIRKQMDKTIKLCEVMLKCEELLTNYQIHSRWHHLEQQTIGFCLFFFEFSRSVLN
jgi:hypothetical protein